MMWYQWFSIFSLVVCTASLGYFLYRIVRLGKPVDYSPASGLEKPAIIYSFTGAMSPLKKESAFLHLPTYVAGLIYHIGTFTAIILYFIMFASLTPAPVILYATSLLLIISAGCGTGILVKRMVNQGLRDLSSPDDYLSNLLVTLFQLLTAAVILLPAAGPAYYILTGLLLLYIPAGKLRHAVYFFGARYHLGVFYGHRNVWPPKPL